jgi:hypothetical protein
MSTLKVANIHFEATGTNRVEYVANNINFRTGGGNFTISVGGAESLNVNASSVMISGANILASVAAAYTAANNSATSANLTSAWGTANAALANTDATFAGNLTLSISRTVFVGNATVNTSISAGSILTNGVALGGSFEAGTVMLFRQNNAPTGWTKKTCIHDAGIRLVNNTISQVTTSNVFSTVFGQTSTGATTLSTAQMPAHTHSVPAGGSVGSASLGPGCGGVCRSGAQTTGSAGGGTSHTHPISLQLNYVDMILASKN